jgi:glycosyltransferase involved in cell wall biosynthesis
MIKKVVFANRHNCFSHMGGDTVQMLKTKEYLEANFGISISCCTSVEELRKHKDADLVHIFNIQTIDETLAYIKVCKEMGKKIALSTIYWDLSHAHYVGDLSRLLHIYSFNKVMLLGKRPFSKLKAALGTILGKDIIDSTPYKEKRKKALLEADMLLPNSFEELEILSKEFDIPYNELKNKAGIVPNAVDTNDFSSENINVSFPVKDYVLTVGRIEPVKNQLNIIKALYNQKDIPIVLIGRFGEEGYAKKIQKLAKKRGNVHILGQVKHEELAHYYKNAKVHVLPSFRESPGLSSLEALYNGSQIVVSSEEFCPTRYYKFNEYGYECNPYDTRSIKNAILSAWKANKNNEVPCDYFENISYKKAAMVTYEMYEKMF